MCGICGIFNEKNQAVVTAMLTAIHHRGPDSFSTTLFENHSLGECGLQIVSGKDDELPLIDKEKRIALLFNGEIYNHKEIKSELQRDGCQFYSDSDAEVIIPLYKKYGVGFVKHIKGMFSIVIVEKDKKVLVRDRFGIKPLYYYLVGKRLIFGSELKAVIQHPEVTAELDKEAFEELRVFGYIYSEELTPLKGIRQVPAGTIMSYDGSKLSAHKYFHIPPSYYMTDGKLNYNESVDQLTKVLRETFTRLLAHGNHETGIYLSGGLDSTIMAVFSSEIQNRSVKTYTLYDSENAKDYLYARKVSAAIGSEHHEFLVTSSAYIDELPGFIFNYENLMAGGVFDIQGALAFQILSKHISGFHKVAFTGEGADELFGGYYWIYTHPLGFSDRIRKRASFLPEDSKVRMIVDDIFPQPEDERMYQKNLFDTLVGTGLSNYHLWSVDRSCAAFGFEIRPPYLFGDIADFALSLPIEFKVPDKQTTKRILKDAALVYLQKYELTKIITRKKYGMPAALEHVGSQVKEMIEKLIPTGAEEKHPFSKYLKNAMDVLLFDLFYYFIIYKKGKWEPGFSIRDFYKGRINENMYDR